jgi:predicted aspartyl protease
MTRFDLTAALLLLSAAAVAAPVLAQHAPHAHAPASPAQAAASQDADPAPPKVSGTAATVPFELYRGNRVIVTGRFNGNEVETILDTGASITTLDRAFARRIGIAKGPTVDAYGAGGRVDAELVTDATLSIGGMTLEKMTVAVMDLSQVAQGIGRPVDIIVGRDLFNSTALDFDWSAGKLTITPAADYTPPAHATVVPVERRGPFNFVTISVAGLAPIKALLDLGSGGNLILPSDYWSDKPVLAGLRYADQQAGGVGGVHAVRAVTVPEVAFAGVRFANVPSVFGPDSKGNQPQHGANLGIGFLKQFDLTLDLGRDRLILRPLQARPEFERDRSGARLGMVGDKLDVLFVSPQGPAAAAGLKAGDRIVAIDGEPVGAGFYRTPLGTWNRRPSGTPVELTLADGRRTRITLADYF